MSYREIKIPKRIERQITEPAPVIQWLKVDQLVVDERYQRPLSGANWAAIEKIAKEFMWSRFSAVLVAPIEGGRYAIIDGQHRVHAAAMIGVEQVPAMIVLIRAEEQAKAFVDVNTKHVRIHSTTIYKAAVAAGEEWAVKAQQAVTAAGCRILGSPTSLRERRPGDLMSIELVRGMVTAGKAETMTACLNALMMFDPKSVPNFSDYILKPLFTAASSFPSVDADTLLWVFKYRRPMMIVETAHRYADLNRLNRAQEGRNAFAVLIKQQLAGEGRSL